MAMRVKVVNEPPFIRVKGLSGGGSSAEIILNCRCKNQIPETFRLSYQSATAWSVIRNETELRKLDAVCGSVYSLSSSLQNYARGYSMLRWNEYFNYTVTAIYSDDGITEIKDHPLSYYSIHPYSSAASETPCVLKSDDTIAVNVMAYKVKISLKSEFEYMDVYFTQDGKAATTDTYLTNSYNWAVYDAEGNLVPYNYDKIYKFVTLHKVDGTINNYGSIEKFSDEGIGVPKGNLTARANGTKYGYVMKLAAIDKPSVEVVVNLNCLGNVPAAAKFSGSSDYWYAIVRNAVDKAALDATCGTVPHKTGSSRELGFGVVKYNSSYSYEVLELYSDDGQTVISELDPKDFHIEDSDSSHNAYIKCSHATTIPAMSYKLKITLK